jgi:hypothetical protein
MSDSIDLHLYKNMKLSQHKDDLIHSYLLIIGQHFINQN